jgi:ribonuclease P protein component
VRDAQKVGIAWRSRLSCFVICPLRDPKAFIALNRSRHRCQTEWFSAAFHFVASDDLLVRSSGRAMTDPCRDGANVLVLGFVLPKKLIKRAVDRNQVKRWARAGLQQVRCAKNSLMVIRPRSRLVMRSVAERTKMRDDLMMLIASSTQKLLYGD